MQLSEQETSDAPHERSWLSLGGLLFGVAVFCAVLWWRRPGAWSATDDGLLYFLPHILNHTSASLHGYWPGVFWSEGAGWSPFESGQAGVSYPLYHLSNLVARAAGDVHWLLEVSGALHLVIGAFIAYAMLPSALGRSSGAQGTQGRRVGARHPMAEHERVLWALLLALQPAPFILGLNWHDYGSSYPWFLWLALWCMRPDPTPRDWRQWAQLLAVSAFFCWSAHPQMYVLGGASLVGLMWASHEGQAFVAPRGTPSASDAKLRAGWWSGLLALALAQLPHLPTLWHIGKLVQDAAPHYVEHRFDPHFVLGETQGIGTLVKGSLVGNLAGDIGFDTWTDCWEGAGMLFCPLLYAYLWRLSRTGARGSRRGLLLVLAFVPLIAAKSFGWIGEWTLVPIGLRWSWKLSAIWAPIVCLLWLQADARMQGPAARPAISSRMRTSLIAAVLLLSLQVAWVGSAFNLFPPAQSLTQRRVDDVVAEAQDQLQRLGVETGDRIALVGVWPITQKDLPALLVLAQGAAPTLLDLGTAHTYEPLENEAAAAAHWHLALPGRMAVPAANLADKGDAVRQLLRDIGVSVLVAQGPQGLRPERSRSLDLGSGFEVYVERIMSAEAAAAFPGAAAAASQPGAAKPEVKRVTGGLTSQTPGELRHGPGGALRWRSAAGAAPPSVVMGRPIDWVSSSGTRGAIEAHGEARMCSSGLVWSHFFAWLLTIASAVIFKRATMSRRGRVGVACA